MYSEAVVEATTSLLKRISISSTVVVYMALAKGIKMVIWLRDVLNELDIVQGSTRSFKATLGFWSGLTVG